MSFQSWLKKLRSAFATGSASPRATSRLNLENLEDRNLLSFSPVVSYPVGAYPQAIVAGHFNNDAVLDLAVANNGSSNVSVLLGNPNGTFAVSGNFGTDAGPLSVAVGDFNSDGKLDLATANAAGVSVLSGNGDGTFGTARNINIDSAPTSVAVGDFNGDGKMDLAVTSNVYIPGYYGPGQWGGYYGNYYYPGNWYPGYNEGRANVLIGDGNGSFSAPNTTELGYGYHTSAAVADFNSDGIDDLATVNADTWAVSVLLGNAGGYLQGPSDFYTGASPQTVAAADVNGDLKTDLVTANAYSNTVSVLLGDGGGGFGAAQNYAVGSVPTSVVLGDFNHDTKLDIAAANPYGDGVSVLLGRGNGTFSLPVNSTATPGAYSIAAGDFNGDGWLDAVSPNSSGNNVSVLINDHSWPPLDAPTVSINDVSVTEGNIGSRNATFMISLSAAYNQDVTVHYQTANGNATAGSDYSAGSGDVTVPAGSTTKTFTVAVIGDRLVEPNETFFVNLSKPTNGYLGDSQGIGTILDDEPLISINDTAITEGNTGTRQATFIVNLSAAYDVPVVIGYATANGTATAGSDYQAASGTLTIPAGQISGTITVLVNGDKTGEANETFLVNLSNPSNAAIADGQGAGTIVDDEPRVSINNVTHAEGNRGQTLFTFTVTLSAPSDQTVTLSFRTVNGTATTGNKDYNAKNGTLTFKPGETTKTITITVIGDRYVGGNEMFYVDLFGLSGNAQFSKSRGIGTILNDD